MQIKYAGIIIEDPQNGKILLVSYIKKGKRTNAVFPGEPLKKDEHPLGAAMRGITDKLPHPLTVSDLQLDSQDSICVAQGEYFVARRDGISSEFEETETDKSECVIRKILWVTPRVAAGLLKNGSHHKKAFNKFRQS